MLPLKFLADFLNYEYSKTLNSDKISDFYFKAVGLDFFYNKRQKILLKIISKEGRAINFNKDITDYFDEIEKLILGIFVEEGKIFKFEIPVSNLKGKSRINVKFEIGEIIFDGEKFKSESIKIDELRDRVKIFKRLQGKSSKDDLANSGVFNKWYEKYGKNRTCCYCGIDEKSANEYFENDKQGRCAYNRGRGKSLEIERIKSVNDKDGSKGEDNKYSYDNCRFACYACNNAKSDFIRAANFEPIAKGINVFWNEVLKPKKIPFPEEYWKNK